MGAAAVLFVLTVAQATGYAKKPEPASVTMKGDKQGAVTFDHATHAAKDKLNVACKTCHHNLDKTPGKLACGECHKAEKGDAPSIKDAGHGVCLKCHKEKKGTTKAPTACKDCHKK
ncbi:MAG: cytochrome c3 family protein [Deltaproteobacteria bacterium]|nr:cytochrome c3 family protein [Deltaproteobacteria bacterium]